MNLKKMSISCGLSFQQNSLKVFSAIWSAVIIVPLVYATGTLAFIGHPWRVELAISLLLFIFFTCCLFTARKIPNAFSTSPEITLYIVAPFAAFITWSAFSAFWAESVVSVIHHTLVWAVYLIFFLLALKIVSDKKLLRISLISLGLIIGTLSACSVIEFIFRETIDVRYARYAESFAALLPLFFSLMLRSNRKYFSASAVILLLLWLGVLFSLSRGAFLSSVIGLSLFVLFRIFSKKTFVEKRRLIFAIAGFAFIFLLTQIPSLLISKEKTATTFSRVNLQDEKDPNTVSLNARFLFAGISKQMFVDNYMFGVGADNFGLEFNKYRAVFSANPENKFKANLMEDLLPQRAHNEFLQILTELGIVGTFIFLCLFWGIVKLGFSDIKKKHLQKTNILTHSVIAGIAAFMCSSMFSSFSFRLMQNGLVFFFLLAILLRNFAPRKKQEYQNSCFNMPPLKTFYISAAMIACVSLTVFSAFKGISEVSLSQAEKQDNFAASKYYYEKAVLFDPANASANYSYAMRLYNEENYQEAAAQMEQTIQKGVNSSVNYSHLISLQILADQNQKALAAASEAVEIFPYSVFLRTRYAALLKKFDMKNESDKQFDFARRINKKQADTWQIVLNEGTLQANREAIVNKNILKLDELRPAEAIYTLLEKNELTGEKRKTKNSNFNF